MKMELEIKVFVLMDEIVRAAGFKKKDWALASHLSPARISDLSRLAKLTKLGKLAEDNDALHKDVGRAFTIDKCISLIGGVKRLMGNPGIEKLLSKLHEIDNKNHRNFIMLVCLTQNQQEELSKQLEILVRANYPNVVFQK